MEENYLYIKIADSIRRDIACGNYRQGDALPSIRSLAKAWQCTIGTVQRAIQELVAEGFVSSHVGRRNRVIGTIPSPGEDSLRRASLIHRAETFLLEMMTSGYSLDETEDAFRIAVSRWQSISQHRPGSKFKTLHFSGSHDLVTAWIATHFSEIAPGYSMQVNFVGSLSGLTALKENKADIAGTHLWDVNTGEYNIPYLHRLFPDQSLAMITLAQRRIGFIVKKGNPKSIHGIDDLARPQVRFVNRQEGSGTRVLLDSLLQNRGIDGRLINGYPVQKTTHSEIAYEVAEDHADVGIGLEAAARSYGLDFEFLTLERYDLVVRPATYELPAIQKMIQWLQGVEFRTLLNRLGGYEYPESGRVSWT